MAAALPLRTALVRGAVVTLANWPVILIEFSIESLYKLALAVPIVGGALMVNALAGSEVRPLFAEGLRTAAGLILSALLESPIALGSFSLALALVAAGGAALMFMLKAGTLAVLVKGERAAGDPGQKGWAYERFIRAHAYDLPTLLSGIERFGRRMTSLALWLSATYGVLAALYLAIVATAYRLGERPELGSVWPVLVALTTGAGIVAVGAINLIFDLMRVIVVSDDCDLRIAAGRLSSFLVEDIRQVIGIFGVVTLLFLLMAAVSILVAAGLALVAWVPFVGLIVVPLQAAAWVVRGLMFQYMGLSALSAYQAQYRRFREAPGALFQLSASPAEMS
jgi:hypothetical protein